MLRVSGVHGEEERLRERVRLGGGVASGGDGVRVGGGGGDSLHEVQHPRGVQPASGRESQKEEVLAREGLDRLPEKAQPRQAHVQRPKGGPVHPQPFYEVQHQKCS